MSGQPWLDDLSEDWIPQPCSSQSSLHSSISESFRQSRPRTASTSIRMPRSKPSASQRHVRKISEPSRLSVLSEDSSALSEHSFSMINVLASSILQKDKLPTAITPARPTSSPSLNAPESPSAGSDMPVENSTMQIKPRKSQISGDTPEWKKRIARGEAPMGEGGDLFGPMELENVFRPPRPTEATTQPKIFTSTQNNPPWSLQAGSVPKKLFNSSGASSHEAPLGNSSLAQHQGDESYDSSLDNARCTLGTTGSGNINFDPRSRTVSGMEELRNEEITPILFSNQEILESILSQAKTPNSKENFSQSLRRASVASDDYSYYSRRDNHAEDALEITSQSLPEDLSVGTMDFVSTGGFVSMRRGGYSNDGSFRRRQLTPTSMLSPLHSSSFLSSSKIRSSPPIDRRKGMFSSQQPTRQFLTPHRTTETKSLSEPHREGSSTRPTSSGSPLKLFGEYDTFTNNKLLRRMSQFEETFNEKQGEPPLSPSENRHKGGRRSRPTSRREPNSDRPSTRGSRAGVRDQQDGWDENHLSNILDASEQQTEGLSLLPAPSFIIANEDRKGGRHFIPRGRQIGKNGNPGQPEFHTDPVPEIFVQSQASAVPVAEKLNASNAPRNDAGENNAFRQSETKRVLNSPTKDPCRKRRRTLQNVDANDQVLASSLLDSTQFTASPNNQNQSTQYQAGLPGELSNVRLLPQVPRPRTPTPAQTRSYTRDQGAGQMDNGNKTPSSSKAPQNKQFKPEDKLSFIASPSNNFDESRKGSITTQDFINEATKIMNIIRAKGAGHNGLSSVEESQRLSDGSDEEDYAEESTQEEFSRPPSREGVDLRKFREPRQQNPRIVSHLKKFEDKDDFELYMGGSVMSLHLDRERNVATYAIHSAKRDEDSEVESSPKNIRIREKPSSLKKANTTPNAPGNANSDDRDVLSHKSTEGSFPTASSRGSSSGSGAKGIISSDMIAHLIPEQVGAMTYDRSAHTWVKGDAAHPEERPASKAGDESSEHDPFVDIPDLSVDELQELMAAKMFSSPATTKGKLRSITATFGEKDKQGEEFQQSSDSRPRTRDGRFETSSVQSKSTRFTSSCPKPETRATSWGTEELAGAVPQQPGPPPASRLRRVDELVQEPVDCGDQKFGNGKRNRTATISFATPSVSRVEYEGDADPVESEDPPPRDAQVNSAPNAAQPVASPQPSKQTSPSRVSSRRATSFDSRAFKGRPISRIDERNEDSASEAAIIRNPDFSLAQIPSPEERSIILPDAQDMDTSYSFQLAPLSDFTMNQMDESMRLEVSYVAQRTHPASLRQVHGTFTMATEDLIKHITDTEPYEPYWEHLRRLNLKGKGLITLHRLNEFCSRLEELDASDNNVGQVSGIPWTIRSLKIPRNCLSNLTSWGHLSNLQYLDVSGNNLEDLDAFSGLIHLRSLKASSNRIRNIRGIMGLNGLLTLKLRNNSVSSVDFGDSELTRLINLDMRDNQLSSVRNIGFIKTLEKLDLRGNRVQKFESSEVLHCLHSLKLSNNLLECLDVSNFPNLHLVYADGNHLSTITGLYQCHYLDVISLREQTLPSSQGEADELPIVYIDISATLSLRKLYLSSNLLSRDLLSPPSSVPSLQFLDLASCTLEELPSEFGTKFPNLRALNLNFNALTDVAELKGLTRLGRVSLVGNRISRLRKLCQVLRSVGGRSGALTSVDLRGNPITVGFYPSPVSGSGRVWRDETGKLVGQIKRPSSKEEKQLQLREDEDDVGFPTVGGCTDIARKGFGEGGELDTQDRDGQEEMEVEIDDPYTVPPANVVADRKYVVHLDEATKLRRRVVELMVQAAAAGRLRVLNGLPTNSGGGCVKKDDVWRRLEELGVLKRREV
ncbi:hypothetical protein FQN53_003063 [Emmonsiellopsis sp. PD_33]|nr:hypothetical protein FQN53_003063 [Emmonsiellopsis sp. PD_33]